MHTIANSLAKRLVALLGLVFGCIPSVWAGLASGFQSIPVFTGLTLPTALRFAPDGRVFVAEKSGVVRIFSGLGDSNGPDVISVLPGQVHDYWDRGLLGLAVHPDFPAVPYVYALYTHDKKIPAQLTLGNGTEQWGDTCPTPPGGNDVGCVVNARLVRLEINSSNQLVGTPHVMVEGNWCAQFPGHAIGTVEFGTDGALYVGAGDGASWSIADHGQVQNLCQDPMGGPDPADDEGGSLRSQDLLTPGDPVSYDGTILRIDPITGEARADNPLVGGDAADDDRIIAFGLRNPFRFTARPGKRELWIGDVGLNSWEEINVIASTHDSVVENFGWPCYEGRFTDTGGSGSTKQFKFDAENLNICERLYAKTLATTLRGPFYAYRHSDQVVAGGRCGTGSSSISAIAFYAAQVYPTAYRGGLFFADSSRQCIYALRVDSSGNPDPKSRSEIAWDIGAPVDLKSGPGGDLYYVDIMAGTVNRLQYSATNQAPVAVVNASPTYGAVPLAVTFDASDSTDANPGDTLTYAWDLDNDGQFDDGTNVVATRSFAVAGSYTVRLRVGDGSTFSIAVVTIAAGDAPPKATITAPSASYQWAVGDSITVTGTGRDDKDGVLPAAAFHWEFILQHCATPTNCHAHVIERADGVKQRTFVVPNHEYPAYLDIVLQVRDSAGLVSEAALRLDPVTTTVTFAAQPSGLQLIVGDTAARSTPFQRTEIVGSSFTVAAPSPQARNGVTYNFDSWSDGGAASHAYVVLPGPQTLLASFTARNSGPAPLPKSAWKLRSVDSQELVGQNGAAINAFDGKSGTVWHTQWKDGAPPPPHHIAIDLSASYSIHGFQYLPRQDASFNGTIARYRFYVSTDGVNWGPAAAAGSFAATKTRKSVTLSSPVTGRFFKLEALSEVNGKPWTSAAEIDIVGVSP